MSAKLRGELGVVGKETLIEYKGEATAEGEGKNSNTKENRKEKYMQQGMGGRMSKVKTGREREMLEMFLLLGDGGGGTEEEKRKETLKRNKEVKKIKGKYCKKKKCLNNP